MARPMPQWRPRYVARFSVVIAFAFFAAQTVAQANVFADITAEPSTQRIDQQCLASYDVKDRAMKIAETNMSCRHIEEIRLGVLESLQRIGGAPPATSQMARLRDEVSRARTEREKSVLRGVLSLVGNYIAMYGLITCIPPAMVASAGGPCIAAAIGTVIAKIQIVDGAISFSDAVNALSVLEAELEVAERKIEANTARIEDARASLIGEFNGLCAEIRAQCL